jgi:hypothetical protein
MSILGWMVTALKDASLKTGFYYTDNNCILPLVLPIRNPFLWKIHLSVVDYVPVSDFGVELIITTQG